MTKKETNKKDLSGTKTTSSLPKKKKRGFVGILKGKIHYKSDAIFNLAL